MGDSESASCWGGASLFVANDDDVMDEDSETDEFITASENEVEDEDSEEDEFAKQIREPEEIEWGRHGKWGRSKWIREQMGQQVNEEEDEDSEEDELWNTDDMMRIQIGDGDAEYRRELRQLSSREKQTDSAETIAKRRLYAYQQEQRVRAIVGRYWRRLAVQTNERELELETDAHATEWDETETFDAGRHSMKSCDEEEHEECSGVAAAAAPPDEMRLPEESEAEPAEVGRTSTTRHRAGRTAHTFERFTRFVDRGDVGALTGLTAGDT